MNTLSNILEYLNVIVLGLKSQSFSNICCTNLFLFLLTSASLFQALIILDLDHSKSPLFPKSSYLNISIFSNIFISILCSKTSNNYCKIKPSGNLFLYPFYSYKIIAYCFHNNLLFQRPSISFSQHPLKISFL